MPLSAFHNNPTVKKEYVARVQLHHQQDDFARQISGGKARVAGWRGRAVECTVHDNQDPYGQAEGQLGVPAALAQLEDILFEWLPENRYRDWPLQFLQAIPVGATLGSVWPAFAGWLLSDPVWGVGRLAKTTQQRDAISLVATLWRQQAAGEALAPNDWALAFSEAAAALGTATAASDANAASAAHVLADAAASTLDATSAVLAAAQHAAIEAAEAANLTGNALDAAADAASEALAEAMATKLLELLAAAPRQEAPAA